MSFPYRWQLKDKYPAKGIKNHKFKVFGTFVCGGGSTMGYKLAGFNHIGGVEIDPKIAAIYKLNHKPKHLYVEDIRDFRKRDDLPGELYELDILDGSPPCSSFSFAGKRDKDWGKEKKFAEGQTEQVLDDLFFEYIALARKLQPKIVLAENVIGLISGNARAYVRRIMDAFNDAGYDMQLFLLNAARMGVPQSRRRVFFIGRRKGLNLPSLSLNFNEKAIPFSQIDKETDKNDYMVASMTSKAEKYWDAAKTGKTVGKYIAIKKACLNKPLNTIIASNTNYHPVKRRHLSAQELMLGGSFPLDYDFSGSAVPFIVGMSVPPVMTAMISQEIYRQWLKKLCVGSKLKKSS